VRIEKRKRPMTAIRGVYNGENIQLLEDVEAKPNAPVIVTFLDEEDTVSSPAEKNAELAKLWGSWRDDRAPEDIVHDIYSARTSTEREV
jgi:hypothetical protein